MYRVFFVPNFIEIYWKLIFLLKLGTETTGRTQGCNRRWPVYNGSGTGMKPGEIQKRFKKPAYGPATGRHGTRRKSSLRVISRHETGRKTSKPNFSEFFAFLRSVFWYKISYFSKFGGHFQFFGKKRSRFQK